MTSNDSSPPDADTLDGDVVRQSVRATYAAVARGEALSCCGPSDCGDGASTDINMIGDAYDGVDGYVEAADLKLGCGLPVEHAGLAPGQTVLDLGAGAESIAHQDSYPSARRHGAAQGHLFGGGDG